MNIVLIVNDFRDTEWVQMYKENCWYIVSHYVGRELKRKCRYEDFFQAIECLKEWRSYFKGE